MSRKTSCEGRDDGELGEAGGGSDGGSADAGEVVAIGAWDASDDAEPAEAGEPAGDGLGSLQEGVIERVEEIEALIVLSATRCGRMRRSRIRCKAPGDRASASA